MNIRSVIENPRAFSSVVNSLKPDEVRNTKKEIRDLIDIEEEKRNVAKKNVQDSTASRDAAKKVFDDAVSDLSSTRLELQVARDKVAEIEGDIVKQKQLINSKEQSLDAATKASENAQAELDKVTASVTHEEGVLKTVLDLLQKLKDGDAGKDFLSKVAAETKGLVLLSRTSKLLASPSFISALTKADPAAVQRVIDLVNQLIEAGKKSVEDAQAALEKAKSDQSKADADLEAAKAALAQLEKDLEDEKKNVIQLEQTEKGKEAVEKGKKDLLDEAEKDLLAKQTILDNENKRINGEQKILLEGEKHLGTLSEVLDVLEE